MGKKKLKEEEALNTLRIGDLTLVSNETSMKELVGVAQFILKDEAFQSYLELKKKENITGGYFG